MTIPLFVILFILLFGGFSIALSLGISSSAALYYFTTLPLESIPQKIFTNPSEKRTEDYITGRFG